MNEMPFDSLYAVPSKNGVSYPTKLRGSGVPMVNMRELFAFDRIGDQEMELAPLTERELRECLLEEGDLLFARQSIVEEGAGRVVLVGQGPPRTWEGHLIRVRLTRSKADPRYFYYLFRSRLGRARMRSIIEQVAAAGIRASDLGKLAVPVPGLDEQRRIAEVLSSLDDKIEANSLLVATADELWTALLDARFVAAQQAEWSTRPLSELAHFVNGRAFTKDASGTGRVVVRIAELRGGPGESTVYNDIDVPDQHVARPGDLLFAWSGSLMVHRWFRDEAIVNQHIFKVMPRDGAPLWLVHWHLLQLLPEYQGIASDKATTMGHIQRHHLDVEVAVPDSGTIAELDEQVTPLWLRALAAQRENLVLAELRDTLLPKLISGKLRVRDAVAELEAAS